eukprot:572178-Pyramimonas_sp.AAC.1
MEAEVVERWPVAEITHLPPTKARPTPARAPAESETASLHAACGASEGSRNGQWRRGQGEG